MGNQVGTHHSGQRGAEEEAERSRRTEPENRGVREQDRLADSGNREAEREPEDKGGRE